MKRRIQLCIVVVALAACQPSLENLPPLPDDDTEGLLPVVAAQLDSARSAVLDDPGDAKKNGDYAMALHAYDHSEAAFVLYQRARQLAPKDARWPFYQSAVMQRLGDLEGSLVALDDAIGLMPDHIDIMAKRGEALFLLSRFDEAEDEFLQVLSRNPDYPLANFYLAKIQMERQNWELAAASFEDLLRRGLDVREVHQSLGTVYRVLGRADEAEQHLRLATRDRGLVIKSFDPVHLVVAKLNNGDQPHLLAAREHYYRGNLAKAEAELLAALEKNPDSVAAHSHLLRIYAERADLAGAKRHLDRVVELEPNNSTAYASWGLALANSGRHNESVAAFERALELAPGDAQLQIALAGALARAGRHADAVAELDTVIAEQPDNLNARVMRGGALLALGRDEEALTALRALQVPENDVRRAVILRTISQAQQKLGRSAEALESLNEAAAIARQHDNAGLTEAIERELSQLRGNASGS